MILVDTSIWIQWLNRGDKKGFDPEKLLGVVTCPPIIQEILQGIRNDLAHKKIQEALLALPLVGDSKSLEDSLFAAHLYRSARRKGYTLRSSVDCLIAAIAIRNSVPILHRDRDFDTLSKVSDLRIAQSL